jgi:hypothetical protein
MMASPDSSTTAQNVAPAQETEVGPLPTGSGSMVTEADQAFPFHVNASPQWSTTAQYELVGHETDVISAGTFESMG